MESPITLSVVITSCVFMQVLDTNINSSCKNEPYNLDWLNHSANSQEWWDLGGQKRQRDTGEIRSTYLTGSSGVEYDPNSSGRSLQPGLCGGWTPQQVEEQHTWWDPVSVGGIQVKLMLAHTFLSVTHRHSFAGCHAVKNGIFLLTKGEMDMAWEPFVAGPYKMGDIFLQCLLGSERPSLLWWWWWWCCSSSCCTFLFFWGQGGC